MSIDKAALAELPGKTIKGVVTKQSSKSPFEQIFLVFTDNSYFEIYGSSVSTAGGLDMGGMDEVRAYMSPPKGDMQIQLDVSLGDDGQLETKV